MPEIRTWVQPRYRPLVGLYTGLALLTAVCAAACPLPLPTMTLVINRAQLTLEIATTPEERKCGLSGRDNLPPDSGLLFALPEVMPFAVWMKNTRIPLSIAFIDGAGRIVAIAEMPPLRTDVIYRSPEPVRYAIEVNQGWFRDHNLHTGDVIELSLPAGLKLD